MTSVTPTGEMHAPAWDDVFFSTTDAKGVITQANEVFIRIARHPVEELKGAPHNIIRHPDMPGGAFRIVWDELLAGRTTAAYVLNLAGDGSAYWALATISPADGGFLSVRCRPARTDLVETVEAAYRTARAEELSARAQGVTAAMTARLGEELLLKSLSSLGFESYAAFERAVLVAELQARIDARPELPSRPDAPSSLRVALTALTSLEARIRVLFGDLAAFQGSAATMRETTTAAEVAVHDLDDALQSSLRVVTEMADTVPLLTNAGPALHERCAKVDGALREVMGRVAELQASRDELRFRVATALLQAESMVRFVVGLIDGVEDAESARQSVVALTSVLKAGVDQVLDGVRESRASSERARAELEQMRVATQVAGMTLTSWRGLVDRYAVGEALGASLPRLDDALARTTAAVAELGEQSHESDAAVSFDLEALGREADAAVRFLADAG